MKLTAIFLLAFCLQISARTYSQQVSLKTSGASLEKVFAQIEKQSGYSFVYSKKTLEHALPVSVDLINTPLPQVLAVVFRGQPLSYSVSEQYKYITVSAKKAGSPATASAEPGATMEAAPPPADVTIVVTDADGKALEGASVTVKGNNKGLVTDVNGRVTFKAIDDNALLVVSYTGYEAQEFRVNKRSAISIQLKPSVSPLDEIQIGAYTKNSKRLAIDNHTTVKGEDIEKQPVSNVIYALKDRVPGLEIKQVSGIAGGGVTMRIQGQNSLRNGNDPFFVIDGVPYPSQILMNTVSGTLFNNGNTGPNTSPLNYINPNDIESVDILKDADATAIYGSRAANGAILITTKKGKAGATKVDFNIMQGVQFISHVPLMNTQQYLAVRREAFKNDGLLPSADPNASGSNVYAPDLMFWDTTRNTDWQKTLLDNNAQWTNISGTISGGTNNIQYLVGATYNRQGSLFPGNYADQKGSVHFNINTASANQKFRMQFSGSYLSDVNQLPKQDILNTALTLPSDAPPLYNTDGTLNWAINSIGNNTWTNPLTWLYQRYKNSTSNLIGNAVLKYNILHGLEIGSSFGYNKLLANEFSSYTLDGFPPASRPLIPLSANYTSNMVSSWIIEPQIVYRKNTQIGKIEALVGSTISQQTGDGLSQTGTGYLSEALLPDMRSANSVIVNGSTNFVYKYAAIFGRASYNWLNKYLVSINVRRDGSSRFGDHNKFHNFWSVGGGWILTEEKRFKSSFPSCISFGKLRASYGSTGSDNLGDYQYLNLYNNFGTIIPYQGPGGSSIIVNRLTNPDFQWEETRKLNLGLDIGFFRDRILLNVNYAQNRSSNQLMPNNLPSVTGFSNVTANFPATIQNTSWEFSLNTMNIQAENIKWSSRFNITIPKNKLIAFPNVEKTSYSSSFNSPSFGIGLPISNLLAFYHFLGVNPQTGVYQFADKSGNPTSTSPYSSSIVDMNTRWYGGMQQSFTFKNLTLDLSFQYVNKLGRSIVLLGSSAVYPGQMTNASANVASSTHWQKPGDIVAIQKFSTNGSNGVSSAFSTALNSDAVITSASYLRLTNVSLSYLLPNIILQRLHLKNIRLYLSGQNLLTITKYPGFDPENQSSNAMPPMKLITGGIQIGL